MYNNQETWWKRVWSGSSRRTNSRPRAWNLSSRDSLSAGTDRFNLGKEQEALTYRTVPTDRPTQNRNKKISGSLEHFGA